MKMLLATVTLMLAASAYAQPTTSPMHAGKNVGPICTEGAITRVAAHDEQDRHYYYTVRCVNGRWERID